MPVSPSAVALKVGNAIVLTAPEDKARTAADKGTDCNDVVQAKGLQAARSNGRAIVEAHAIARAGQTKEAPHPVKIRHRGRRHAVRR